ncbi:MAG: hypothetical protein KDK78_10965, partial [Chlamydiia bacterium]|nr:hypothetical protein [Chlamydiia bacterium]
MDLAKRIALLQDYQTALSAAEAAVIDEERKRLRVLSQVSSDLEAYLTWIEALEDRSDLSPSSIKVFDSGLDQRRQLGLPPVDESVVNRSFLRSVRLLARSSENVPMTDVSAMEWRDPYSRRFEGSGLCSKYKGSATHLGFFTWLEEQSACRGEVWQGLKKIEKSVIYLREDERPRYLVSVKRDGAYTLLCQEGSNLDTSKFRSISSGEGTGIFVLGLDGKLYAAAHSESERGLMHHSSFFAGGDVLSAGELVVEQGVLKSLSNRSGHYRPDWKDPMLAVLDHLHNKGVDLSAVRLELVGTAELSDEIILSDGTKKTVPFSVRMTAHVDAGIFHENRGEDVAYTHGWVRRIGRWKGRLKEALSELDPELLGGAQVALRTLYGVDRDMTPWTGADKWNFYG